MTPPATPLLPAVLFLPVGLAAGWLHFALLRRNADLFVRGGGVMGALGLQLARMALTGAVLLVAARVGWPALLACAAGVLLARQRVIAAKAGQP